MKPSLLTLACALAFSIGLHAGDKPFPHQIHINNAYKALEAAAKQVKMSSKGEPGKHLAKASNNLAEAKSELEAAKKNKGSARPSAIKLIDQAQTEIESAKDSQDHRDKASGLIFDAMKEVIQAGKNGEH